MKRIQKLGLVLGLVLLPNKGWAANAYKAVAKEFSRAARESRVQRLIVLPFVADDGSSRPGGLSIAETLTTQLVRQGRVQVIERAMLHKLLEEHHLGTTGVLDATKLQALGRILSADAVITGTYMDRGRNVVLNARLIHAETGLILAASEREIQKTWDVDSPSRLPIGSPSHWPGGDVLLTPSPLGSRVPRGPVEVPSELPGVPSRFPVQVPQQFPVEVPTIGQLPALETEEKAELRDSAGSEPCADAPEQVDRFERQILDLKARYWALQLKKGLSRTSITHNPGSTITDPLLKREFYNRMKSWYAQEAIPELTLTESLQFTSIDSKALALFKACGL